VRDILDQLLAEIVEDHAAAMTQVIVHSSRDADLATLDRLRRCPSAHHRAVSALRQSAVQFFDKVLDSDVSTKFATIGIMVTVDTQMRAETVEHLDDLGCLPIRSAD
jgi:hypothetical protein